MDIKHLTHIVALAEQRNFARAAKQLNLSQPALSRSIQAAEAQLGLRLFDRGTLAVTPTPAGAFVLERARRLVFDSRCLTRDVDLFREHKLGDTAFGVGPFVASTFLTPLLEEMRRSFAGINLRVAVGNWELMADLLAREDIEFFVTDTRDLPPNPDLVIQPLRREFGGFYARTGHPLTHFRTVTMSQAWAYGIATVRLPQPVRATLARLMGMAQDVLPIALECDDLETLRRVAKSTDTLLAATHAAVKADVERGELVALDVSDLPRLFSQMGVVALRGRSHSPTAEMIISQLPRFADLPKGAIGPAQAVERAARK